MGEEFENRQAGRADDGGDVETRVFEIICRWFHVERREVTRRTSLLDYDSVDTVDLVLRIEDAFGIQIPDGDAAGIRCVGQLIDYLNVKLATSNRE